jgi:DNA-directed RNA polymerase specialized sigma24 family protein
MERDDEGSVTVWIRHLKTGDGAAVSHLWERYFGPMVRVACGRLRRAGHADTAEDAEDVALSAFVSLNEGAAQGRLPHLSKTADLEKLLSFITVRKALDRLERAAAAKRGGGRLVGESVLTGGLDQLAGREPTPELAATVAEECQRLLDSLGSDTLRQIALWRLDGCTGDEIAARLGCSRRTVAVRLDLIRRTWLEERL